ncbi:MAG: hypothetical protein QOH65_3057 [Methylobacteriaceae bacterium]|jgi:hypothetical protein|nr:hypothetical protein [Methylobacteriaceae bacterium]
MELAHMEFLSGLFSGVAAGVVFWLLDKLFFGLPPTYQIGGMVACFAMFAGLGYWFFSRSGNLRTRAGTRVASGLKGRNVKVTLDGIMATGGSSADILSDVNAKRDIEAKAKDIKTSL